MKIFTDEFHAIVDESIRLHKEELGCSESQKESTDLGVKIGDLIASKLYYKTIPAIAIVLKTLIKELEGS